MAIFKFQFSIQYVNIKKTIPAQENILHIKYLPYFSKSIIDLKPEKRTLEKIWVISFIKTYSLPRLKIIRLKRHSPVNTFWHLFIHFFPLLVFLERPKLMS